MGTWKGEAMKESFITRRFRGDSLKRIEQANKIIEEYQAQGFTLTVRQLYYQHVARDLLPNQQKEYKNLGSLISKARLSGLIDWNAIEDRSRYVRRLSTWPGPSSIIDSAAHSFRLPRWADQPKRLEVWIEKEALIGVIEPICEKWHVPFFACKGYASQSSQYSAGQRFRNYINNEQEVIVLHLGDHDPSGIDMTRDNHKRVNLFAQRGVEVDRLALNMDQVRQYKPPRNPAKETDSRYDEYKRNYGVSCWELDALEPKAISELIEKKIKKHLDMNLWSEKVDEETQHKENLITMADNYHDIIRNLKGE